MSKKSQQVVPNPNGGWSVKSQGSSRAIKSFDTQKEAVSWARSKSKNAGLALLVHGRDGTVRSSYSYRKSVSQPQHQNGRK
jgi:hypothetical protein